MTSFARILATAAAAGMLAFAAAPANAADRPGAPGSGLSSALVGPESSPPPAGFSMTASPKASPIVRDAQEILTRFGIPAGEVDGRFGPETARGLCAFRRIAGIGTTRDAVDAKTMRTLRAYEQKYRTLRDIPAKDYAGKSTYLVAHQTCQVLFYVEGNHYRRVFASSTGAYGHRTPNGSYGLGAAAKGWYCSTLYPESCSHHTEGWFASVSDFGNMYNPRQVVGAIYLHGSMSVPPYPASHGCIRVQVKDADWMYKYVGVGVRTPVFVTGSPF